MIMIIQKEMWPIVGGGDVVNSPFKVVMCFHIRDDQISNVSINCLHFLH